MTRYERNAGEAIIYNLQKCAKFCMNEGFPAFEFDPNHIYGDECVCQRASEYPSFIGGACGHGWNPNDIFADNEFGSGMVDDWRYDSYQLYCKEGTYHTDTRCVSCPTGKYRNGITYSARKLHDCPAGKTSDSGASSCNSCSAGKYSNAAGLCVNCLAGTFSASGASSCTDCASGKYQPSTGQGSCNTCPNGWVSEPKSTECRVLGNYVVGSSTYPIPEGFELREDTTDINTCPVQEYRDTTTSGNDCATCPAGYLSRNDGYSQTSTNSKPAHFTPLYTHENIADEENAQEFALDTLLLCTTLPTISVNVLKFK